MGTSVDADVVWNEKRVSRELPRVLRACVLGFVVLLASPLVKAGAGSYPGC